MPDRVTEIFLINLEITRKEKHTITRYLFIPTTVKQRLINKLINGVYKIKKLQK